MTVVKNLGLIKAIHVGLTAPINIKMLWYDDNAGVKYLKYYDTFLSAWTPLAGIPISGFIPFVGSNYIFVDTTSDALVNGTNLLTAATLASTLTPNGLPLSNTNRAVVASFCAKYDLNSSFLAISQFVDFIFLGEAKDNLITSANATGTIQISNTNNYTFKNCSVNNTGAGSSCYLSPGQTDNGNWDNIIINKSTPDSGINWAGNYNKITATVNNVLRGNILGKVTNSSFLANSCGSSGSAVTISGLIENCTSLGNSFGACTNVTTISGIIRNCVGEDNCFGRSTFGTTISGTIENCEMKGYGGNGFGYADFGSVNISGLMRNCIVPTLTGGAAFGSLFNGNVNISGSIENCIGGTYAFGYSDLGANIIISGTIKNCFSNSYSFGSTGGSVFINISGIIDNCVGLDHCFGFSDTGTVTISGSILKSKSTDNSFGSSNSNSVTFSGVIDNCVGGDYCFGYSNSSSVDLIGKIKYCTGVNNCFGSSLTGIVSIIGSIENCNAQDYSFCFSNIENYIVGTIKECVGFIQCYGSGSANTIISGFIKSCIGTSNCFASSPTNGVITITGIIENCTGTDFCFCFSNSGDISIGGSVLSCSALDASFCYSGSGVMNNSGIIKGCIGTSNCFGNTSISGKIVDCTRTNGFGVHSGTIDNCKFSDSSSAPALTITTTAIVKYSVIYQASTGECFESDSGLINASIYHCATNKAVENSGNITNNIGSPFNVIDPLILL